MILRKSKRFLYIVMSCILLLSNSSVAYASQTTESTDETATTTTSTESTDEWPDAPDISASAAIVMEANTGLILYSKNETDAHYPASLTKVMTSLLAIENCSLSETVTYSHDAVFNIDQDSSRTGIDEGEELTLEQSLYCVLLDSANEAAYAVAEHVGGTYDNFVDMMNEKAQELGCVNTHFANPHGLFDENHYTCAYDLALIAQAAIKNTTFAKITGTRTYSIPPTNKQEETRYIVNHHKFIKGDLTYDGVIGGKTGYTDIARYTLLTYAERDGMLLICVLMEEDNGTTQYTDTASLLDYGFDNFSKQNISESSTNSLLEESPFFTKFTSLFQADSPLLTTGGTGYVILPNSVSIDQVDKEVSFEPLTSLAEGENVIGEITYSYCDKVVGQTDIIYNNSAGTTLTSPVTSTLTSNSSSSSQSGTTTTQSNKNLKPKIILVIVGVVALFILLYYIFIERPRIKRRKAYYRRRQNRRRHNDHDFFG